jgi:hypothetical protein
LRTADKHGLNGLKIMAPLSPIARRPYNYSSPQAVARSVKKIALKLLAIPELEFSVGVWRHDLSLLDWRLCNGATDRAGGNRCNPARNRRSDDQLPDAASYAPPPAGHSDGKRWAGDVISTTKRAIPQATERGGRDRWRCHAHFYFLSPESWSGTPTQDWAASFRGGQASSGR